MDIDINTLSQIEQALAAKGCDAYINIKTAGNGGYYAYEVLGSELVLTEGYGMFGLRGNGRFSLDVKRYNYYGFPGTRFKLNADGDFNYEEIADEIVRRRDAYRDEAERKETAPWKLK